MEVSRPSKLLGATFHIEIYSQMEEKILNIGNLSLETSNEGGKDTLNVFEFGTVQTKRK